MALLSDLKSLLDTRRNQLERKLNVKEAAAYLGISVSTLYKNVALLPHRRFGKKLVFVLSELHDFDFSSIARKRAERG
jgi:excisionase family DNA binding protein